MLNPPFRFKALILFFAIIQYIPSRVESFPLPMNEQAANCRDFAASRSFLSFSPNYDYAKNYNACLRGEFPENIFDKFVNFIEEKKRVAEEKKLEKEELAKAEAHKNHIEYLKRNLENIFD